MLPRALALLIALGFLGGCFAPPGPDPAQSSPHELPIAGFHAIDPDVLSKPRFPVLPMMTVRMPVSSDGIRLYLEIHRPDTSDPVPTILHSSPYNALGRTPAFYGPTSHPLLGFVKEYVPRGYAVVVADVRGFGESEGCVEVWSKKEQQDQYDLVEWIAKQSWSNGRVGMFGASYPGTTPLEAAVMGAPHLTTIIAVAGLTDPYFDWHHGGVPNGESYNSPASYQAIGAVAPVDVPSGVDWVKAAVNAGCGTAQLLTGAYQMNGVYTDYYRERNLSARVGNVKASVLFTQGFTDNNVKPSQLLNFFNELNVTKKGYFGQWAHQYPARPDIEDIQHAWFDEHLMDIDTGILRGPIVEVTTNRQTWRAATEFPPTDASIHGLHLDGPSKKLTLAPPRGDGIQPYRADRAAPRVPSSVASREAIFESEPLASPLHISGVTRLAFNATIQGDTNTFFSAEIFEVAPNGEATRIVFGALNAALRGGFDRYVPVPEGRIVPYSLSFQPREWVVNPGDRLRLVISAAPVSEALTPEAARPVNILVHSGPEQGSLLQLPVLEDPNAIPLPYRR